MANTQSAVGGAHDGCTVHGDAIPANVLIGARRGGHSRRSLSAVKGKLEKKTSHLCHVINVQNNCKGFSSLPDMEK